ncbi:hypothetical protein FACS189429_3750 [Bacteroidia bacterium]|nr:hypothetical protein FACS189429_3750 [Bacteroidia bacterium]
MKNSVHWLFIEPYVYINVNLDKALLYNTLNGKLIECESKTMPYSLIKNLNKDKNLFVVKLPENFQENTDLQFFVQKIRDFFIGDVLTLPKNAAKPFQMKPIFNIQRDLKIMQESEEASLGTKIMQELTNVGIQINSKNVELNLQYIDKIFNDLAGSNIENVNITGSNIFEYSALKKLIQLLKKYDYHAEFGVNSESINFNNLQMFSDKNLIINVLIHNYNNIELLSEKMLSIKAQNVKYFFTFIVESEKDCTFAEDLINELGISEFSIKPFFNGKNLAFFSDNVFLTKDDILEANPSVSKIYARQVVNQNYYGKLIIQSNGDVYANLNGEKLGNIDKGTLHEFAYKEMKFGKSWRKTRNSVKPCNKCIYKFLCPPVSNYEYEIGKFNLCNLR